MTYEEFMRDYIEYNKSLKDEDYVLNPVQYFKCLDAAERLTKLFPEAELVKQTFVPRKQSGRIGIWVDEFGVAGKDKDKLMGILAMSENFSVWNDPQSPGKVRFGLTIDNVTVRKENMPAMVQNWTDMVKSFYKNSDTLLREDKNENGKLDGEQ